MNYLEKLLNGAEVEWKSLGEVCDFQNGFAFQSSLFREVGLPIVRITNIDGSNVDLTDVKYFNPHDYNSGNPLNYVIERGDVLIAMSGATTGKIGYYNLDEKAYLNQRVGKFIPNKEIINEWRLVCSITPCLASIKIIAKSTPLAPVTILRVYCMWPGASAIRC